MFSGIIESIGTIENIEKESDNIHFTITTSIANEVYIDQSIAHDGVCLTVIATFDGSYKVTAIRETLEKTNLSYKSIGDHINLERAVMANSRMDGHFVQGHVDTTTTCIGINELSGSWKYLFKTPSNWNKYIVPKGSITINGISLTLVDANEDFLSVAIIPYTYQHTNIKTLQIGSYVNLEFDILGKYIINYLNNISLPKRDN
jgi:riboflavin synthase